jgi:hypothetical protein
MSTCFYLGTHQPQWLATAGVPLFVSHRRLAGRKSFPRARAGWALDSGGFSELSLFGQWRTSPAEYVAATARYDAEIGRLDWAAPQDWMCEPFITAKTGLTVLEHQRRTVANLLDLSARWPGVSDAECPFMPVLQGWQVEDYLRCAQMYEDAGVRLAEYPVVGVGSVCRRQATAEIAAVFRRLHRELDVDLHGFGVKTGGLAVYGQHLLSADSMAWSFEARRAARLDGCTGHINCANCLTYALAWRRRLLDATSGTAQLEIPWEAA